MAHSVTSTATRSVLAIFALSMTLAACENVERYPLSQCQTATHYPVGCESIGADDHPGDLTPIAVPKYEGA